MTLSRRTRLERTTPLRRGAGLSTSGNGAGLTRSPASKRRAELDVPADVRELVRTRSGGRCEAALLNVCTEVATDVHHRRRRRDGGHAVTNLLDVCRECHREAHAHPVAARELGLIVGAFDPRDPADVPVAVPSRLTGRRERVRLTADGGYLL